MKARAFAFMACVTLLLPVSCGTVEFYYKRRYYHHEELWAVIERHSGVIDTTRSAIELDGAAYYFFNSSRPRIRLSLYLKPGTYSRAAIISIRDEYTALLRDKMKTGGAYWYPQDITIRFLTVDGDVVSVYYEVRYDTASGNPFRVWHTGEINRDSVPEFDGFIKAYFDRVQEWYYWDFVQTADNGVGFDLWMKERVKVSAHDFPIEDYLNSEPFRAYIENHAWLNADDDFHVTLFFTTYWAHKGLGDVAEYTLYKRAGYTVWEQRE
jgi:hypothetical protein